MKCSGLVSVLRDNNVVDHMSLAKNRLTCSLRKTFMLLVGRLSSRWEGG